LEIGGVCTSQNDPEYDDGANSKYPDAIEIFNSNEDIIWEG
jgi:hypothetical protein